MSETNATKIILVRHGETANAAKRCYNGHFDVDMSAGGLMQIEKLALRLKDEKLSACYSSDLKRSHISAEIIAKRHSLDVLSFKELREVSFGRWEGLPYEEIKEKYYDEMQAKYADYINYRILGDGENFKDLSKRVINKFLEILDKHNGETVLFALHGGVNRVVLGAALNLDLKYVYRIKQDFAALNIIMFYHDTLEQVVELING